MDVSEAIGAGISSLEFEGVTLNSPLTDLNGGSRPFPDGSSPDLGAIENALAIRKNITKVDQNGSGQFTTIQSAIDGCNDGDTVVVQPGTYLENINFNGKNIVVGSLFMKTGDTSYISSTIIDGGSRPNCIYGKSRPFTFRRIYAALNGLATLTLE